MKRTPITRVSKAKALTNPTPEFVSQVIAGANQEPHRVVKMDTGMADIAALFETQELTMKDAVTKAKSSGHDIAQLVFKGGEFTDRAKVDAWLKEGGFEADGYEVTEKTDKDGVIEFTAASTMKFETGSIKKVKGQADGLFVFVGKLEGAGEVAEKTAEEIAAEATAGKGSAVATKSEEPAPAVGEEDKPKIEDAPAAVETAKEAETELGDKATAEDATVAPAAEGEMTVEKATELLESFKSAMAEKGIPSIARKGTYTVSEIGYVLDSLRWLMNDADYNGLSDTSVASIKQAAAAMVAVLVEAMQGTIDTFVDAFKADTKKTDAVVVAKSDAAETAPAVEAPADAEPATKTDELLASLVATVKSVGDAVTSLTATVKEQGEAIEEVKETAAKAAEASLEQGQSRKGADATDPAAPTVDTQKKDVEQAHAQRRLRSAFGSYKGSGFDN